MDQFCYGLHNYLKDLFLTFHEDSKSLTKVISRIVGCDNILLEWCFEWQQILCIRTNETYIFVVVAPPSNPPIGEPNTIMTSGSIPMQIDATCHRGPLTKGEELQWWSSTHTINFLHWPKCCEKNEHVCECWLGSPRTWTKGVVDEGCKRW